MFLYSTKHSASQPSLPYQQEEREFSSPPSTKHNSIRFNLLISSNKPKTSTLCRSVDTSFALVFFFTRFRKHPERTIRHGEFRSMLRDLGPCFIEPRREGGGEREVGGVEEECSPCFPLPGPPSVLALVFAMAPRRTRFASWRLMTAAGGRLSGRGRRMLTGAKKRTCESRRIAHVEGTAVDVLVRYHFLFLLLLCFLLLAKERRRRTRTTRTTTRLADR